MPHEVDKAADEFSRFARRYSPDTMVFGMVMGYYGENGIEGRTIIGGVTVDAYAWGVARLIEAGHESFGIEFALWLQEARTRTCEGHGIMQHFTTVDEIRKENEREKGRQP